MRSLYSDPKQTQYIPRALIYLTDTACSLWSLIFLESSTFTIKGNWQYMTAVLLLKRESNATPLWVTRDEKYLLPMENVELTGKWAGVSRILKYCKIDYKPAYFQVSRLSQYFTSKIQIAKFLLRIFHTLFLAGSEEEGRGGVGGLGEVDVIRVC